MFSELTLSDEGLFFIEQHLTAILNAVLHLQHLTQCLVLAHLICHSLKGEEVRGERAV